MKNIHAKSVMLGACATLLIFVLSSGKSPSNEESIEFVPTASGMAIYNSQSKTVYVYKMWNGNIRPKADQIFKVAEDGASLSEIK